MISDEAFDAAVDALVASRLGDHKGINGEEFVEAARAALEAAVPYLLRTITTKEDLDALPVRSVLLDVDEELFRRDDDKDAPWCDCSGGAFRVVDLPALVLWEPGATPYRSQPRG